MQTSLISYHQLQTEAVVENNPYAWHLLQACGDNNTDAFVPTPPDTSNNLFAPLLREDDLPSPSAHYDAGKVIVVNDITVDLGLLANTILQAKGVVNFLLPATAVFAEAPVYGFKANVTVPSLSTNVVGVAVQNTSAGPLVEEPSSSD
jgi:hypothetical protein